MAYSTWLTRLGHTPGKSDLPSHTAGSNRGEELVDQHGREPGRENPRSVRTARDSTSINAESREPIDRRMPHIPPA